MLFLNNLIKNFKNNELEKSMTLITHFLIENKYEKHSIEKVTKLCLEKKCYYLLYQIFFSISLHFFRLNNLELTINYLNRSILTFKNFKHCDFFLIDQNVNSLCSIIASKFSTKIQSSVSFKKSILVQVCHTHYVKNESAIIRALFLTLFTHYNSKLFEIFVVITDIPAKLNPNLQKITKRLNSLGINLIESKKQTTSEYVLDIINKTSSLPLDLLVATCLDNAQSNIFCRSLVNIKKIAICYGYHAVHTNDSFDFNITPHKEMLEYLTSNTVYVNSSVKRKRVTESSYSSNIKIDSRNNNEFRVLFAGRFEKLKSKPTLDLITNLCMITNITIFIVGVAPELFSKYLKEITLKKRNKIKIFDRCLNYFEIIKNCHVAIDTFPFGGSGTLFDFSLARIPIITFQKKPKFLYSFDEYSHSRCLDFPQELVFNSPQSKSLIPFINKLKDDRQYCRKLGIECSDMLYNQTRDANAITKDYEEIFMKLIDNKNPVDSDL